MIAVFLVGDTGRGGGDLADVYRLALTNVEGTADTSVLTSEISK